MPSSPSFRPTVPTRRAHGRMGCSFRSSFGAPASRWLSSPTNFTRAFRRVRSTSTVRSFSTIRISTAFASISATPSAVATTGASPSCSKTTPRGGAISICSTFGGNTWNTIGAIRPNLPSSNPTTTTVRTWTPCNGRSLRTTTTPHATTTASWPTSCGTSAAAMCSSSTLPTTARRSTTMG